MKTITAVCPTRGRLQYLTRTLASFNAQTYQHKQLVLVNDDPEVRLELSLPQDNVIVVNIDSIIPNTLKRNIGINATEADLYIPWDDDDIFFPNRLADHVEQHSKYPDKDMIIMKRYIIQHGRDVIAIKDNHSSIHLTGSFKMKPVKCKGGYAGAQAYDDQYIYGLMKDSMVEIPDNDISAVYMYTPDSYHLSFATPETVLEHANKINAQYAPSGTYWITQCDIEYRELVEKYSIYF